MSRRVRVLVILLISVLAIVVFAWGHVLHPVTNLRFLEVVLVAAFIVPVLIVLAMGVESAAFRRVLVRVAVVVLIVLAFVWISLQFTTNAHPGPPIPMPTA